MTILEIQDKIIDLEDFFKKVSFRLQEVAEFKRLCFLVPNNENGNYITKYSTFGSFVCLAKKDLHRLNEDSHEDIMYPKAAMRRRGLLNRILFKIHWKIWLRSVSAIMLIYREKDIICLILFFDRLADSWLSKHGDHINVLQQEITRSLEAILLYNQTMERLIREHHYSNRGSVCHATTIADEPTSVLIGKKVEFL